MRERTIPLLAPGQDGERCADLLLTTLTQHKGIGAVTFDPERQTLQLRYDPALTSLSNVERLADRAGVQLGETYSRCSLRLDGVRCRTCGGAIERRLNGRKDIVWASANPASRQLSLEYVGSPASLPEITRDLNGSGIRVRNQATPRLSTKKDQPSENERDIWWDQHGLTVMTSLTAVFLATGWLLGTLDFISSQIQIAFYVLTYIFGGLYATRQAIRSLLQRHVDVDLLMVVAALGAATIGGWVEGGILLFLFSLGNTLEHYALGRTHRAVRSLMELSPEDALVLRAGVEARIPVDELVVGDTVIVRPSERIPVDARVIAGESAVDQAPITGESMPVGKEPGDTVFAGTINGHGLLRVQVERLAQESTLAKIIRIVEEARGQKSRTQRFTDAFEGTYAIAVMAASALAVLIPVLLFNQEFDPMFYRAMTLLVVASPCALVISTPASILSALANAARHGILFKGAVHLENTGIIDAVAFDKTGTLTVGRPRVTDVLTWNGVSERELLSYAAPVERLSEHPLGIAVVQHAESTGATSAADEAPVLDLQSVPGRGVRARVRGELIRIGNDALFESESIAMPDGLREMADELREAGKTTMYVFREDQPLGVIGVADVLRSVAPAVIADLKRIGVQKTILLTGDNERAARTIARQVGIDEWRASLLPEQKLEVIRELQASGMTVAMVGDGVNDAPALAVASVGIAMGAAGTDVALETADVVLMSDDLTKLPYAIELSRKARRIIRQNLTFALSVIVILIIGTLLGQVPLPLGVVGHEGGTIIVVANGLRLLGFKRPRLSAPVPVLQHANA